MPNQFDSAEQAEAAFYAALESGDADAMADIWLPSTDVVCVHPGSPQLLGYDQVLASWHDILGNSGGFRISAKLLHHHSDQQVSVRFLNETLFTEDEESESFTVLATNAYQKTDSGWRLVLHHASPTPRSIEDHDVPVDDDPAYDDPEFTLH